MSAGSDPARYWAYSNYLVALSRLIRQIYPTDEALAQTIVQSRGFRTLNPAQSIDYEDLGASLRQSWFTELLLNQVSASGQQLFPYAIPWSMVQTYYAIYPAIRAYFIACGCNVNPSHQATLRTIGSHFAFHNRFPEPWRCMLNGDPEIKAGFSLLNSSYTTPITLNNPQRSPYRVEGWEFYGLFLRTTRRRQLDKKIVDWKKDRNRKRIRRPERQTLIDQLPPTTLLDALYRIRSRANYQDVDPFLFSSDLQIEDTFNLHQELCLIVCTTLMVFELFVARLATKKWFSKIVGEFVTATNSQGSATVGSRWSIVRDLW